MNAILKEGLFEEPMIKACFLLCIVSCRHSTSVPSFPMFHLMLMNTSASVKLNKVYNTYILICDCIKTC